MLIDHVGLLFFPGDPLWRLVGRISFPLFAFLIAEGYRHSRDREAYAFRLGLLALISQMPFMLMLDAAGITLLDCPLSGTGAQARVKDLVVYASGPRAACRRVEGVFDGFARAHYYVGPFGAGSKTKFVANLLVAIHNVATAEALVLAMKAGLDPAVTLKVVADGAGSSRILQVRGPLMVRGDYSKPTMKLEIWQKDMRIIAEFARQVGCPTPLFRATAPIYAAALAEGRGAEDSGAVCAVLEKMAQYRRRSRAAREE